MKAISYAYDDQRIVYTIGVLYGFVAERSERESGESERRETERERAEGLALGYLVLDTLSFSRGRGRARGESVLCVYT